MTAPAPDPQPSPTATLDEVLMTLVIEFLYFLENTPADDLDTVTAERMTSEIAFQLGRLSPQSLEPLIAFIRRQGETSAWPDERSFLRRLPEHLGWTSDD